MSEPPHKRHKPTPRDDEKPRDDVATFNALRKLHPWQLHRLWIKLAPTHLSLSTELDLSWPLAVWVMSLGPDPAELKKRTPKKSVEETDHGSVHPLISRLWDISGMLLFETYRRMCPYPEVFDNKDIMDDVGLGADRNLDDFDANVVVIPALLGLTKDVPFLFNAICATRERLYEEMAFLKRVVSHTVVRVCVHDAFEDGDDFVREKAVCLLTPVDHPLENCLASWNLQWKALSEATVIRPVHEGMGLWELAPDTLTQPDVRGYLPRQLNLVASTNSFEGVYFCIDSAKTRAIALDFTDGMCVQFRAAILRSIDPGLAPVAEIVMDYLEQPDWKTQCRVFI